MAGELRKQFVPVRPNGTDQREEPHELPTGRLLEAINVHQAHPGELSMRNGQARLPRDIDITTGRGLSSSGGALVLRSKDAVYTRSSDAWVPKATVRHVQTALSSNVMQFGYRPTMVKVGNLIYYFAADAGSNTTAQADFIQIGAGNAAFNRPTYWHYRIVDAVTGAEVKATTRIGGAVGWQAKAVVAGGYVWLFVGAREGVDANDGHWFIDVVRFVPASPLSAPSQYVFYDSGDTNDNAILGFDVTYDKDAKVVIAIHGLYLDATSGEGDGKNLVCARLNPADGQPDILGTVSSDLGDSTSGTFACVQFMSMTQAWKAAHDLVLTINSASRNLGFNKISQTSLEATTTVAMNSVTTQPSRVCGYVDAVSGHLITFHTGPGAHVDGHDAPSGKEHEWVYIFRYSHNLTTGNLADAEAFSWRPEMNVVAAPFLFDGNWCLITAHDDNLAHLQGAYYLLDAVTGEILARALYGEGGDDAQRSSYVLQSENSRFVAQAPLVDANFITIALNSWNGTYYVTRDVTFVFDDGSGGTWGRLGPMVRAADGQEVAIPGAWPAHVAGAGVFEYITQYPRWKPAVDTTSGSPGLPQGWYGCYYLWALRDSFGNVHRSRPSPVAVVEVDDDGLLVEFTCRSFVMTNHLRDDDYGTPPHNQSGFLNNRGSWMIEVYMTDTQATEGAAGTATPYLQYAVDNNQWSTPAVFVSVQSSILTGEALYTFNEAETPNDAAPPFGWAAYWRDRLLLGDTDQAGAVWVSKAKKAGRGYEFSEGQVLVINEGSQRVFAGCPVDFNTFAIFKADGIWFIQGEGPAQDTSGQYEPVRIPGQIGCNNPHSVVTTRFGAVFQAKYSGYGASVSDGGIYMVTAEQRLIYIGAGVEVYRDRFIEAAVYLPEVDQVRLWVDSPTGKGLILVFDMKHPPKNPVTEADQFGQWYVWGTEDVPFEGSPQGAVVHSGAAGSNVGALRGRAYWIDADGVVRYEAESQFYDTNIEVGEDDEVTDVFTQIPTKIHFAPQSLAGLQGAERCYRVLVDGRRAMDDEEVPAPLRDTAVRTTVNVYDEVRSAPEEWTDDFEMDEDEVPGDFDFYPDPQRATSVEVILEELPLDLDPEEVATVLTVEGWIFKMLGFEVGIPGRMRKLGDAQQAGE